MKVGDYGTFRRHKWAIPFEVIMLGSAVWMVYLEDWLHLSTSIFTFIVSFAPLWFERAMKVRLPALLQFIYVAFIFMSMFMGEVFYLYSRIWEWDDAMHFLSGILIGLGGVMWLLALSGQLKNVRLPVWLQTVFVYSLVSAVIVLWEIVEFGSDQIFGTSSQGTLQDTMVDLVYGVVGGGLVCVLLASHLLWKRVRLLELWFSSYAKVNHNK